jgi:histidine triad (HIT) family protein
MTHPAPDREEPATNPTVFGAILRGEIPADIVWEDDVCIAFRDIQPAAPTHVLVIPRRRMVSLTAATEQDRAELGHLMWVAACVARQEGLAEDGYRVVVNAHDSGGQTVFHLHLHVLGGRRMSWPPG